MAISMKDLQSSSDEEVVHQDEDSMYQNIYQKPSSLDVKVENSDTELDTFIPVSSSSTTNSSEHSSKTLWIKGQVSESFKRLSARRSPTASSDNSTRTSPGISSDTSTSGSLSVSLDNSVNDLFEDDSMKDQVLQPANSVKTCCEADGKISANNIDGRDNNPTSRKTWIKGHINNYLSKSKRYYNNRSEVANINDKKSINKQSSSNDNDSKDDFERTMLLQNMKPSTKPVDIVTPPSSLALDDIKSVNNSHACVTSSSPVSPQKTEDFVFVTRERNDSIISSEQDVKLKSIPSRLTFSELLSSDSPSAILSPSPTVNELNDYLEPANDIDATAEIASDEELNNLTDQIMKEDLRYHLRPGDGTSVTYFNIWICTLFTCAYFLGRLPVFVYGAVTGSVITYLIVCIVVWLLCPSAEIYHQYQTSLKSFLKKNMLPEPVKGLPKLDGLAKPKDLKGWVFMANTFDGVFEKDSSKEIFVVIHKEVLYMFLCKIIAQSTSSKSSQKRRRVKGKNRKLSRLLADQVPVFTFECSCQVDLTGCSLALKPDDLPIRRVWNKKYPIQLITPIGKLKRKKIDLTLEELTLTLEDMIEDGINEDDSDENVTFNDKEEIFYLFGNTGREKEDWFYRLQLCIAPLKHQVTFKDIDENRLSTQPSHSYPYYMAELIKESEKVMQRTTNGKKMEPYLAWLNIFLGRAFWDVWHDKMWTEKLHQKIQSRLSKLNTPPFITDITLKDLNCGHNIPIIHKGSIPVLDEYGIWTDLQVSYKGYFTLTLETQLNIDYYVGLVNSIVKQKANADPREHSQFSKIKLSGLANQCDESLDDNSCEKDSPDSDGNSLCEVDDESVFHDEIQDVYSDAFEQPYVGLDNEIDPVLSDPRTKAFLQSRTGKKVVSLVGWLAKSKLAKRVAETDFAKKAYERAYKKFQKMPIVLKVEIQSVKGNVAVNIPPPPTNRLWYGFRGNPVIFITASPKVGDKQVRLTYLTNWIERKLKEEFKKFLVLPNMQDLSIKLMDSHLRDISPDRPFS